MIQELTRPVRIFKRTSRSMNQHLNYPQGRLALMCLTSQASTTAALPLLRFNLEFLHSSKWRRPALERMTLPVAVILNRLATDFFVLLRAIAFGMGQER